MESKQDVFDAVLAELKYAVSDNDRLTEDQIDAELTGLRGRYAAASKVVVPQAEAERQWVQDNCPYCHSDGHTRWDNRAEWGSESIDDYRPPKMITSAVIDLTDNELIVDGMNGFKIHNCPMCGRKLDGK